MKGTKGRVGAISLPSRLKMDVSGSQEEGLGLETIFMIALAADMLLSSCVVGAERQLDGVTSSSLWNHSQHVLVHH
eukprot:5608028-Ditylum_brightwellii.AAC.1